MQKVFFAFLFTKISVFFSVYPRKKSIIAVVSFVTLGLIAESNQVIKEDSYGREYRIRKDGTLFFPIDTKYFTVIPSTDEFAVHNAEARGLDSLLQRGKAIQLRKNLSFCANILNLDERNKYSDLILENSKFLNLWLSLDKERYKSLLLLDSCYYLNRLFLRNEEFSITIQIPTEKIPKNLQELSVNSNKDKEVEYTIVRWKKKSINEKAEITIENALEEWNSEVLRLPEDALHITFAMSKHKLDDLSEDFLINYWEKKRGLTPNTKSIYMYSRKKNSSEYTVSFNLQNLDKKKDFTIYEKYIFRNRKAISIFYQFPTEKSDEYSIYWKDILETGKFQGKFFSNFE